MFTGRCANAGRCGVSAGAAAKASGRIEATSRGATPPGRPPSPPAALRAPITGAAGLPQHPTDATKSTPRHKQPHQDPIVTPGEKCGLEETEPVLGPLDGGGETAETFETQIEQDKVREQMTGDDLLGAHNFEYADGVLRLRMRRHDYRLLKIAPNP